MALKTIRVTKEQMNSRVARFSELKANGGALGKLMMLLNIMMLIR